MENNRNYLVVQHLDIEFTDQNGIVHHESFEEHSLDYDLTAITRKMAFIVECHLTDNNADFLKPISIIYKPISEQSVI